MENDGLYSCIELKTQILWNKFLNTKQEGETVGYQGNDGRSEGGTLN